MSNSNTPIAIVGSACRFAGGATTPSKLWDLLRQPTDVLRKIDRFGADGHYHADGHHHGTSNVRHAYLLNEDPKRFDAPFFNIAASEADAVDPQQRMLLETVYESIESAGLRLENVQGTKTAVYVGTMTDDYAELMHHDPESIPTYAATGSSRSILANRISYYFDWHGPSMSIDTACSSSLVALHHAVQTLRAGESSMAIAAGSNLIFGPKMFIAESNLNMLSPTGRSRMWDADADGYARGEGLAAIVLKTLPEAIAAGDHIECIVRETGVNQDGRTPGITMPSSTAQTDLIRDTYSRAGLDIRKLSDRPQYFEAHGTGTKAGDPREARAIFDAFCQYPDAEGDEHSTLYVGSFKTVAGHTEGTAGLAGVLKASLALQNKTIPPNLLFNTLNPDVKPFYVKLQIATEAKEWPSLPSGVPRRASVNSFGFGGTNAHAILESFEPDIQPPMELQTIAALPLTFSAMSERSLVAMLHTYSSFLSANPGIDMRALATSLFRRSALPVRVAFPPTQDPNILRQKIDAQLSEKPVGSRPASAKTRSILGIFTGQGAQWPSMGRELLLVSPVARKTFEGLEESLRTLPDEDRPGWTLAQELMASAETSRISQGVISQPLCTAIQLVLVDLLRSVGIVFEAVVGHSSGEIAAAYAAGFISSRDAIRIAYYRGQYTELAKSATGEEGRMLAVGTSMEDADELCRLPTFKGRLGIAACNSSASITMSGDADAVKEAVFILEDEQKFARTLKVDTAYHSHHMLPCVKPYLSSLRGCQINIKEPSLLAPKWYSSVHGGRLMKFQSSQELESTYWNDNMLRPVLFSQALQACLEGAGRSVGVTLEVGPHPALKGPASLTIQEINSSNIPYSGLLSRGKDDREAFSSALGIIWTYLGPSIADLTIFDTGCNGQSVPSVLKGLPPYPWDHERQFWSESRGSKITRARLTPTHELLGVRSTEDREGEHTWRNYLKLSELPWLRGHQIQEQVLFPAAGYVVSGLESLRSLVPLEEEVCVLEVHDAIIHRALSIPDDITGVEVVTKLVNVVTEQRGQQKILSADFSFNACLNKDAGSFVTMATAILKATLGEASLGTLPQRGPQLANMTEVDVDFFYGSLWDLGYNYRDMFKGITSLSRTTDAVRGTLHIPSELTPPSSCLFHPSTLDVAFQTIFGAIGVPGRLWSLHVPLKLGRLRLNPLACPDQAVLGVDLGFDANLRKFNISEGMHGDVDVYDEGGYPILQVEGMHITPVSPAGIQDDRQVFAKTIWSGLDPDAEDGFVAPVSRRDETTQPTVLDRVVVFYLKKLTDSLKEQKFHDRWDAHRKNLWAWATDTVTETAQGQHPLCQPEWLNDSESILAREVNQAPDLPVIKNLRSLGQRLISFMECQDAAPEDSQLPTTPPLHEFDAAAPGRSECVDQMARVVGQITHRYPHMNILEIVTGVEAVATRVIEQLGQYYLSYTLAEIAMCQTSDSTYPSNPSNIFRKPLDLRQNILEQGFAEHAYDVILVPNTLYATESISKSLHQLRQLVRPGGYIMLLEASSEDSLGRKFVSTTASACWTAANWRHSSPSLAHWDSTLRETGFSGVDTSTPAYLTAGVNFSLLVSQAVDAQISLLRRPLMQSDETPFIDDLIIIGGETLVTLRLVEELCDILEPFCHNLLTVTSLETLDESIIPARATVLSLLELDAPLYHPFTPTKLKECQALLDASRNVLWVTKGTDGDQPFASMMIAVSRCLAHEMPDLRWQSIDVGTTEKPSAKVLAEMMMQVHILGGWKNKHSDLSKRLWTFERETIMRGGKIVIPRYTGDDEANNRFNSFKRVVRKDVDLSESTVAVVSGVSYDLRLGNEKSKLAGHVDITLERSVLSALEVASGTYLYLVGGVDLKTQQRLLAFANNQQSKISVPESWTISCSSWPEADSARLFQSVATNLQSSWILANVMKNHNILVHGVTPALALALKEQSVEKHVQITMTTSIHKGQRDLIYLHPFAPDRLIESVVPNEVSVFVDLSDDQQPHSLGPRLAHTLPTSCARKHIAEFSSLYSTVQSPVSLIGLSNSLQEAYTRAVAQASNSAFHSELDELTLDKLVGRSTGRRDIQILNWKARTTVPVRLRCAADDIQFRNDRTYFLVGMTGEVGLSLTQWMMSRGAKYFALTSRNPRVNPEWIEQQELKGAVIRTFPMDVTRRASVMATHQEILHTMPPIAGVTNAAMVIADGIFTNISYETMSSSIGPKVQGSIYLDELFRDNSLDFFILFSSITSITGNVGQSSYAAANAFMTTLAKSRRQQGLVGSVMNLAGIFGLGYVTRAAKGVLDRLIALGFSNICEWDFHQNFAQAVMVGHPESGLDPEVSAGLAKYDVKKQVDLPIWLQQPKFTRYRLIKGTGGGEKSSSDQTQSSISAQLKEQTTNIGVAKVLLDGLLSTLRTTLQMNEEDSISPEATIVELGVDSLVAVEMRSWFSNELDLDMPVLKLLGGASIADLVDDAVSRISPTLIPNVDSGAAVEEQPGPSDEGADPASSPDSENSTSTKDDSRSPGDTSQTTVEDELVKKFSLDEPGGQKLTYQRTTQMGYGSARFWFLRQYLQDPTTFNCVFKFTLTGRIREVDAERAVSAVGERHEAFRTTFFSSGDMKEPTQGVLADSLLHLEKRKISDEQEVAWEYEALTHHNFDIENGETVRIVLLSLNPWKHFLIFCHNHIAMDGFSFNILLDELNRLYLGQPLPPVKLQFTDFVERQRAQVKDGSMSKHLEYWRDQFSEFSEVLPLFPVANVTSRLPLISYSFEEEARTLDSVTSGLIRDQSRRHKSTVFHFFLAVLKIFLFRHLDVDDVCIGVADASRGDRDTTGTIGFLLNLLPLRFKQSNYQQTFKEAVAEARTTAYSALQHSGIPFDVLLEELQIPRSSTYSPVFQVFMDYRQIAVKSPKMLGTKADATSSPGRTAYDLILDVRDIAGGEMTVSFRSQQSLYSHAATKSLFESYMRLVTYFTSNPAAKISTGPLFDNSDVTAAIQLGQGPTLKPTWPSTVSVRIEEIAHQNPTSLAVQDGLGASLTFEDLTLRVNAISASLVSTGATHGSRVAVFQEPSTDWVPTMLAIWKIGGTYVPLELTNSLPRLVSIVKDSQPAVIVCHGHTAADVTALALEETTHVLDLVEVTESGVDKIPNSSNPEDAAVVLYTSGSTGTPKGIVLKHSSICNEIEGYSRTWGIGREIVLQQSAFSFDFSLDQMLTGLANGGTIHVVSKADRRDPVRIAALIATENITYTKATPSEYCSWLEHGPASLSQATAWAFAFAGGEPLTDSLKRQFRCLGLPSLRLHNSYGPGEITISCTKADIPYHSDTDYTDKPISLGKPLPNYALYIVDRNMQVVPQGVTGEIVIAGLGAAIGYLNKDIETQSRFLPDIYSPEERKVQGWTTVYRSGDVGRLLSDGSFTFERRIDGDTQVKIRGLRIELEDIESTIVQTSGGQLSRAVASVRGDPAFLVAHAQFVNGSCNDEQHRFLRDLKDRLPLPQYMRPAIIVPVDRIPINSHAKLDRLAIKKLPLLEQIPTAANETFTPPEQALREVWISVLPQEIVQLVPISSESNFFDLGGNSLLLVKLQAAIRQAFDVAVPLITLLESGNLRSMATKIRTESSVAAIDWEEETKLPVQPSFDVPITVDNEFDPSHPPTILLTGATGFLGRHVLQSLVDDERIATIHCVAVRPSPDGALRSLVKSPKVIVHQGNLSSPLLGLSRKTFARLSDQVDTIIHSGANRAFWDHYQSLRGSNVTATKTIIQLAHSHQIPVHFISSGGVSQLSETSDISVESVATFKPPTDGSMGYIASKWASEVSLEKAANELGIPVHIHRVTPPQESLPQEPSTDVLSEFSRLAIQTKSIPVSSGWHGTFDLIPVGALADDIRNSAVDSISADPSASRVTYTHHPAELTINMNIVRAHLNSYVDEQTRSSFEQILPHKWAGRAKVLNIKYHFASQDLTLSSGTSIEKGGLQLKR